jgi:rod shape determining protein RodA
MFGMLLAAGASPVRLGFLIVGGLALISFVIYGHYSWGWPLPLQDYQLMRLVVFVNPMVDPRGWGWNVIQSQIAVGSGGLLGKGWGMVLRLRRFSTGAMDGFYFQCAGGRVRFCGGLYSIASVFILIYRAIKIAGNSKDTYGTLVAIGVTSMFSFHILQNIGMSIGIMPKTGIPLPFVSYGGSACCPI